KHAFIPEIIVPDSAEELKDVYAPSLPVSTGLTGEPAGGANGMGETIPDQENARPPIRFIDAIKEGLTQSMEKHDSLVLMGQDIAEYGGAFKITEGLADRFGKARVRNTPLCESAIVGCALGLSLEDFKAV